jgi:hypothetical protein
VDGAVVVSVTLGAGAAESVGPRKIVEKLIG